MSGAPAENQVQTALYALSHTTTFRVFPNIVGTALFAIFTVLIFVSSGILLWVPSSSSIFSTRIPFDSSKGLRSWHNRVMLVVTLLMYAISAGLWAISLKLMWNELNLLIPGLLSPAAQGSDSEGNTNALSALNTKWSFVYLVLFQLNVYLSDAVALWRVYVIWGRRKSIVCSIAVILITLVGVNIIIILLQVAVKFPASVPKHLLSFADRIGGRTYIAYFAVSAFANVWATFMVAWKAWSHRREIRQHLRNRTVKGSVESILMMLVESSVVYSILAILQMLDTDSGALRTLSTGPYYYYLTNIMVQVSGMYPTVVIVLAALQKLHGDHQFSFVGKGPDASNIRKDIDYDSQTSLDVLAPREKADLGA
ncbi:hypothetical protein OF83DRAFT_1175276 [Amylostereum chailletii]|nr:hypothetical protein OF83DRAFT_1175276 [Amylostereum chailletii]